MNTPLSVLLVEDDPGDARLIHELLAEHGADVVLEHADTLAGAIERLSETRIELILLDLTLPDSQGIDTYCRIQEAAPEVAVVVLSRNTDLLEAQRTVNEGAQDFLVKGRVDGEMLVRSMRYAQSRMVADHELRRSEERLTEKNAQLVQMVYDVAEAMGRVVEARDPYTQGHQERVAIVAKLIAQDMGLPDEEVAAVEMASLVHDIGKMSVPAEILSRPGVLSDIEMSLIKEHSRHSFEILKDIAFPWPIAEITLQHHERMDGSGYPKGLVGTQLLLAARIIGVADVVEAMSSHRPYRAALGMHAAVQELKERSSRYDPRVVASCVRVVESGSLSL